MAVALKTSLVRPENGRGSIGFYIQVFFNLDSFCMNTFTSMLGSLWKQSEGIWKGFASVDAHIQLNLHVNCSLVSKFSFPLNCQSQNSWEGLLAVMPDYFFFSEYLKPGMPSSQSTLGHVFLASDQRRTCCDSFCLHLFWLQNQKLSSSNELAHVVPMLSERRKQASNMPQ